MKKLILALALVSGSISAAPWEDPYLDRVRDLDNATLEKLSAAHDMPATVQLARNLMEVKQTERGLAFMRMAADAKVPTAQWLLGGYLWYCIGGCRDKQGGLQLIERAVQAGHPVAHEALASIYEGDSEYVKKVLAKSYALYLAAAEAGIGSSQLSVALKLCSGEGVKQDREAGRKWLDLAQKDQQEKFSYEDAGCE